MNAQGILFLNRQRPSAFINAAGELELVLSALDRVSPRQCELWQIRYVGQRAKDLWDSCSAVLTPGQPIHVTTKDMRVHKNGAVVIEAKAETIAIAPRSHLDDGAPQ
jgi:hypothetical protein